MNGFFKIYKKIFLIIFNLLLFSHQFLYDKEFNLNGVFTINSKSNESLYFSEINGTILFQTIKSHFDIIQNSFKDYNILSRKYNKYLGINNIFRVLKLYEYNKILIERDLKIVEKEPIDVFIKYIDLSDKTLKREGIKQIYKDQDNEELKYSLRSILQYIPWVRKIFIVMPNTKVKFLKPYDEIKEKIIYVNDKDFLGFDTANIFAFSFSLYKMEKFGITKNFIYMEDDYFLGKPFRKSDFFYYDRKEKKIFPYILTSEFSEFNINHSLRVYQSLVKIKDQFKFQGGQMWIFSIVNTGIFFEKKYNMTIINTEISHNARAENLDDLKEMYKSIQSYKYINETLFSKERHILSLNQPYYNNLFQLNIRHRKVNSIAYRYIDITKVTEDLLDIPLFVINTGGDIIPTKEQYNFQKKVMQNRFPIPSKYEI